LHPREANEWCTLVERLLDLNGCDSDNQACPDMSPDFGEALNGREDHERDQFPLASIEVALIIYFSVGETLHDLEALGIKVCPAELRSSEEFV
jgi:hypothetical protein